MEDVEGVDGVDRSRRARAWREHGRLIKALGFIRVGVVKREELRELRVIVKQ